MFEDLKLFYNARIKNPPPSGSEIEKNQNKVFRYLLNRKSRCPTTDNENDLSEWIIPDKSFADFSKSIGLNEGVKAWHSANRNQLKNPASSGIFGSSYPKGETIRQSVIFQEPDNEIGGGKGRKTRRSKRSKRTKRSKQSKKRRSTRRR